MVGIPTVVAWFRLLEPESCKKAKYWVAKTKKNIAVLSTDRQTRKHNILRFITYRGAHDSARFNILVSLWRYSPLGSAKLGLFIGSVER